MTPKWKILHVNSEKKWAGGEVQNFLLLEYLQEKGYPIHVACQPGSAVERKALERGYSVETIRMRNYLDLPAILRFRRYLKRERFDIVHIHTSRAHVLAGVATWLLRNSTVVVTRRMDYPLKKYFFTRFLYQTIPDRVVAISCGVEKAILDAGIRPDKVEVIFSGISLERFETPADPSALRKEFRIPEDCPLAGVVASFHPRKGHARFLEVARIVLQKLPNARFLLVGEGPTRPEVEKLAHSLGIAESIVFTGQRADIVPVLAAIDVLAMPSLYEGLGVSILEAMSMGKPAVCSDVGGIPEIVSDGVNGFLVAPLDVQRMAEKLALLLDDKALARRMGEEGRELVREKFSSRTMASAYESLYGRLIEEKGRA